MSFSHKNNNLLIAHPNLRDPNFYQSVVLIIDRNPDGVFGLIINKQEDDISLFDVFAGIDEKSREIPVYFGGPVQPEAVFILHEREDDPDAGQRIMDGLFMGSSLYLVERLLESNDRMLFIHGYAGWGKNQLENEIAQNSWIEAPFKKEDVPFHTFSTSENIWRSALEKMGGIYKYYSNFVKDPGLN